MIARTEPLWWFLFSAGGMVAALLFPAMMLVTGVAVPAGWMAAEDLYALVQTPVTRIVLFVAISLPLFHGAHRLRHTLAELKLQHVDRVLAILCYGAAVAGTIAAIIVLAWR